MLADRAKVDDTQIHIDAVYAVSLCLSDYDLFSFFATVITKVLTKKWLITDNYFTALSSMNVDTHI